MFFSNAKIALIHHSFIKLCLLVLLTFPCITHAEEPLAALNLDTSQDVIYCSVSPHIQTKQFIPLLQDGIPVTFTWDISIEKVRNYWINKSIGDVLFYRQIIPDLVSRQWLLKDSNSGITHTARSSQSAFDFLTQLEHFPVIDKSLLTPGVTYQVRVRLHMEEGEVSEGWWSRLTKLGKTVAIGSFTLP